MDYFLQYQQVLDYLDAIVADAVGGRKASCDDFSVFVA